MTWAGCIPLGVSTATASMSCSGKEGIDIVIRRNTEFRRDRVGSRPDRIADRDEPCSADMAASKQFGMTLGNAPTPEQAKSDHHTSLYSPNYIQ